MKKKKSKKSKAAPKDTVSATGPDKMKVKKGKKKKKENKGGFKGKPKDVGDRSALLKSVFGGGGS